MAANREMLEIFCLNKKTHCTILVLSPAPEALTTPKAQCFRSQILQGLDTIQRLILAFQNQFIRYDNMAMHPTKVDIKKTNTVNSFYTIVSI